VAENGGFSAGPAIEPADGDGQRLGQGLEDGLGARLLNRKT
jgi:hypothetical protein